MNAATGRPSIDASLMSVEKASVLLQDKFVSAAENYGSSVLSKQTMLQTRDSCMITALVLLLWMELSLKFLDQFRR